MVPSYQRSLNAWRWGKALLYLEMERPQGILSMPQMLLQLSSISSMPTLFQIRNMSNVATGKETSLLDLVQTLNDILKKESATTCGSGVQAQPRWGGKQFCIDWTYYQCYRFTPTIQFQDGLREMIEFTLKRQVEWCVSHGSLILERFVLDNADWTSNWAFTLAMKSPSSMVIPATRWPIVESYPIEYIWILGLQRKFWAAAWKMGDRKSTFQLDLQS